MPDDVDLSATPEPMDNGVPLDDELFYQQLEGGKGTPPPTPQSAEEIHASLTGTADGEEPPPSEEPAPPAEPEPPVDDGQGDEGGEDDPPNIYPDWDPERQKRDQDAANQRKELEEAKRKIADLTATVDALTEQRTAPSQAADDDSPDAKLVKEYEEEASKITGESSVEDIARVLSMSAKATKAARKLGFAEGAKGVEAVANQLKALQDEAKSREDAEAAAKAEGDRRAAEATIYAEYTAFLAGLNKDYGKEFQNDAKEVVTKRLAEAGYTSKNPADLFTLKIVWEQAYKEVSKGKPRRTPPAPAKGKPPRGAPGRGGGAVVGQLKPGSREDVLRQMKAQGAFKPPGRG